MTRERVLIVGGAGYIGGHMTDCLHHAGFSVTIYDNLLFENRYMKEVDFVYGDIRDKRKLSTLLKNQDVVIWLAGLVGDGACAVNAPLTRELNVDCPKWLVDNFNGKIVFPSTCSVYGINNDLITEDAEPNPLSLYAATKLEAEQYILNNAKDPMVFRLGTLYGLGDLHSRIRLDLVVNILSMRAARGEPLTVFGGEQWRPLLHVRDAAEAFVFSIEKNLSGLYNLSRENYQIKDLAHEIAKIVPNTNIQYVDMKFEDLRNYKVNNSRILNTGWESKYSLECGISQIYQIIDTKRLKNINDIVYSNAKYMSWLEET